MLDTGAGSASILRIAEDPAARIVLVHVCNDRSDDVTSVVQELTALYVWDGEVDIHFDDDGEEIWILRGVEDLDRQLAV